MNKYKIKNNQGQQIYFAKEGEFLFGREHQYLHVNIHVAQKYSVITKTCSNNITQRLFKQRWKISFEKNDTFFIFVLKTLIVSTRFFLSKNKKKISVPLHTPDLLL